MDAENLFPYQKGQNCSNNHLLQQVGEIIIFQLHNTKHL